MIFDFIVVLIVILLAHIVSWLIEVGNTPNKKSAPARFR